MFNRSQVVNIDDYSSLHEPIYCGLPRVSILGPILFTYIYNNFIDHDPNSEVIMYVDVTVIYVGDKDVNKIWEYLNEDLRNISDRHGKNELIINLNKGKTEVILSCSAQQLKTHEKLL